MIGTIARREILDAWREGRVRLAAATLLALLLLALAVGVQHWQAVEARRSAAQAADAHIWRDQGAVNPHSAAHFGRYIYKHPGPLAFVDEGINPYAGSAVWLEAHVQTPARARPAEDAALLPVFGELTPALLLQLLVPLLIVLVAFAGFAGERENGTFRLVLSTGASRRSLVLGKALGLSAALGVVLVPLAPLGAAAILLGEHEHGSAGIDLVRFASLSLTYLIYFAAWIGLTLAVSARAASSRQSLVILIGFWLIACLLAPRLAVDTAERLAPVPSIGAFRQAISDDLKNGISGHDPQDQRLDAIKQKLLEQYGVARVEDLPINFDGIDLAEGERYGNEVMDRQYGRLWSQYERQAEVQRWFAVASPIVALRPLSMALAGTDLAVHRDFTEQAERFRRAFIEQVNDYHTMHGRFNDWSFTAGPELWAKAPPFAYVEAGLAASLAPQGGNFALLLLWLGGSWLAALWALRGASVEV